MADAILDTRLLIGGEPVVSYSPNAEDIRLLRVFRDVANGFYVDVGAGHPSNGSVTRLFYDRGWSGINLEPGPEFGTLAEARPRDVTIKAAVGEVDGPVTFFVTYPDPSLSTLDLEAHRDVPHAIERFEEVSVDQSRLDTILRQHASSLPIHFLKVDVEGAERQVLASSDWQEFRPIVVVVEAVESWSTSPTHERWEGILHEAEYEFAAFDGINRFYVEREHRDLIPALAYPVSVLDRFTPAVLHETQAHADALRWETKLLRQENNRLRDQLSAVYRSRTWRAGRIVWGAARPAIGVARRVRRGTGRPHMSPEGAYRSAVRKGAAWHFPRARARDTGWRVRGPLERLLRELGPVEHALDEAGAARLRERIDRLGWADEMSLLERRLSWVERQAVVETDALARTVSREGSSSDRETTQPVVVVDARCLQDPNYRARGVGLHARGALRAIRGVAEGFDLVLLASAELPKLSPADAALGDRVAWTPLELRDRDVAMFVELSPMTASCAPATPFLTRADCSAVALVYDFIPGTYPAAYLASATDALENRVRLETLRHYDLLLPISSSTGDACRRLLDPRAEIVVTGVEDPLHGVEPARVDRGTPFVLIPGGADSRKNVVAGIAGVARYRLETGNPLRAVVTGKLTKGQQTGIRDLARESGLPDDAIELLHEVEPERLADLHATADAVIVPSLAEGFSIPVVEAVLRGAPVLASDIEAHRELLGPGPWLFPAEDIRSIADGIARTRSNHDAVLAGQRAALADIADPEAVRSRMAEALRRLLVNRGAERRPVRRTARGRPQLAVVSPYPPQRSGVADYTKFTLREVAKHADVRVYTSAPHPASSEFPMHQLSSAPYLDRTVDAVVNIVGNSHYHFPVLDLLGAYGGACIAHDASMVESYGFDRGYAWLAAHQSTETRAIKPGDVGALARDIAGLPAAGYDMVAKQAAPLIVHGHALAARVERETGVRPLVVPFVPYNLPEAERIGAEAITRSRRDLGLDPTIFHLGTFGFVDQRTKGHDLIVGAVGWLRSWGHEIQLHVVGEAPPGELRALAAALDELGIPGDVTFHGRVPDERFRQFLLAVDLAVQIRRSSLLTLSGGLMDCLAFGVPTVTTTELAHELDVPPYATGVASETSSLLLAEAIEGHLHRRRESAEAIDADRRAYLELRSVESYARGLLEALGLGT